ncbi:MAG TPA: hypothetical protein VFZ69_11100 [Longimicrobiales bacterium]
MQAWEIYLAELKQRAEGADRQQFGRRERVTDAAHDAYRAAADRLTGEFGWGDEHTLVVMRGLNAAVKAWLEAGESDWVRLGQELARRENELRDGFSNATPPAS